MIYIVNISKKCFCLSNINCFINLIKNLIYNNKSKVN